MTETVASVCPHDCPSACALEVEVAQGGRIGRVRGAAEHPYTAGVLCGKVARYAERIHHPERLTEPLLRRGGKGRSGTFETASWDDALDLVAERFRAAVTRYGPETVWPYYYAGTMGLVQREGINRLRHVMGYSNQHASICVTLPYAGWQAGVGALHGPDPEEMADSDLIVIWGCNAAATQVHVMALARRAKQSRGAPLVVVDSYRNATAKAADLHLMPRPGTDGALACAVMQHILAAGYADREYLARYTDVPEALEAHLESRTPAWASAICGVPEAQIVEFAELYGKTRRSFIRLGLGFARGRNGAHNLHAVSCLPAVTGAWLHRGGGALLTTTGCFPLDLRLIDGSDARDPATRTLDMSRIGPVLTGDPQDLGSGPPVTAMLIQSTNPAMVAPDSERVCAGLERDDLFVCVHEHFMTETARHANVVLPATMFLEHDDLYRSFGHTYLQIGRKVVEPPTGCRSNHAVVCALAERLGAFHPGFQMSEWELVAQTLHASGLSADAFDDKPWLDLAPDFETGHFLRGFAWPNGRFRFKPDWAGLGPLGKSMPRFPDHWTIIDAPDHEHPFRLLTPPAHDFLNSTFTETPRSRIRERKPTLKLHPKDAECLGVVDGGTVEVGNRRARIRVVAERFDGMAPGVVAIEGIWPSDDLLDGRGINALTSADPGAPNGGAVFHDTSVWVKAVAGVVTSRR